MWNKRNLIFSIALAVLISLSFTHESRATNYYYIGTGNLTLTSSWGTNTNGSGTHPSDFTNSSQVFNIRNATSVTLVANWTVSGTSSKVVLGDGTNACTFLIPSTFKLTATIDVSANGYLNIANTTLPNLNTINTTSTIEYSSTSAQIINGTVAYGNLVISATGTATTGSAFTVNGNLTVKSGGILNTTSAITTTAGKTFTIENGGRYIHNNEVAVATTIFKSTESFGATSTFEIQDWLLSDVICPSSLTASIPVTGFSGNFYYGNLIWNVHQTDHYNADIIDGTNLCAGSFTIANTAWVPPATNDFRIHYSSSSRSFTVMGDFIIGSVTSQSAEVDFYSLNSTTSTTLNLYGDFKVYNGSALWNSTQNYGNVNFLKNSGIQNINIDRSTDTLTTVQFICFSIGNSASSSNTTVKLLNSILNTGFDKYKHCIPQVTVNTGSILDLNSYSWGINNEFSTSLPRTITINGTLICNSGYIGYQNSSLTFTSGANSIIEIGSVDGISNTAGTGNIRLNGVTPTFAAGTTFIYNGSANQVSGNMLPASVSNFTVANQTAANVLTLSQALTVTSAASFSNGICNSSTFTLTFGGTLSRTTGQIASGSSVAITNSITIPDQLFVSNTIQNLIINIASGAITQGGSFSVSGTLTMTSGNIITGAKILSLGTSTTTRGTLTYNSGVVITGSTGGFKRWFANSTVSNVLFPVGTSTTINMITLSFTTAPSAGTLTTFFDPSNPGTNSSSPLNDAGYVVDTYSQRGYWQITAADGLSGGVYNLSLRGQGFNPMGNEVTDFPHLRIIKRPAPGNNWTLAGTHLDASLYSNSDPVINRVGINTGFSQFAMGGSVGDGNPLQGPLPVELTSFTANVNVRDIQLIWTTATELNNSGFEIQKSEIRSQDLNWEKVGFVNGSGTKSTPTNYSYNDTKLNTGKYKYRLKQIDYNGNYEYHNLNSELVIGTPNKFDVSQNYPNPFNPETKIDYNLPFESKVTIKVYDISGREVKTLANDTKQAGYYTVGFNGSDFASGMYFYRITVEGKGQKFVMMKKMLMIK